MNGKMMLYRDQYGQTIWAKTVKELREKVGGGHVSKMYRDRPGNKVVHVGYVVGSRWFSAFIPLEISA